MKLIKHSRRKTLCRTLSSDVLRGSHADKFLGIGLSAKGARVDTVESRVFGASAKLAALNLSKVLVSRHGTDESDRGAQ